MIRYRATILVDIFMDDCEFGILYANIKAQDISNKIPNSWVEEVKRLLNGDELTWDEAFKTTDDRTWDQQFRKEIK